jgi:hypothetical protein
MKLRTTAVLCWLLLAAGYVQAQHRPITMVKGFGSVRFEYDTLTVSLRQVGQLLAVHPEAYTLFRKARHNHTVAGVAGALGGAALAFTAVHALLAGGVDLRTAAVGAGLVLVSVPFERRFRQRAGRAIGLYNQTASARVVPTLRAGPGGLGLTFKF